MHPASVNPASAFILFGPEHWATLALIAAVTAGLSWLLRRTAGGRHELAACRLVCWSLAGVLVIVAVVGQLQRVAEGAWSPQESLPLHLCDIAVGVVAVALVGVGLHGPRRVMSAAQRSAAEANAARGLAAATDATRGLANGTDATRVSRVWQLLYELAYTWGLGGTSQAILTPDVEGVFPSASCLRYFFLHGGIVVSVLVMTIGLRMRPLPGTPRRVWLTTLILALIVFPIDWVLKANYMYLLGRPAHPTIIDLFGRWPWSLIPLVVVGTAFIVLVYSPFWVIDRWNRRRASVLSEPRAPASDPGLADRLPGVARKSRD